MLFNWKTLLKVAKRNSKTTLYHQSKVQSNTHAGFKLTYRVTKTKDKSVEQLGKGEGEWGIEVYN